MDSNHDQSTIFTQAFDFFGDIGASHHVQNNIYASAVGQTHRFLLKIMTAVVDGMVSTQGQAGLTFGIATGCDQHMRAKGFGHLDCCHANAAGAALDQDAFTWLQTSAVKHIAPNCKEGFG